MKAKPKEDKSWRERYQKAHEDDFKRNYPSAYNVGGYVLPKYPDSRTANGLQSIICNYMKYVGGVGNRINVVGIRGRKSSTLKGTADLDILFPNGKTAKIEIKAGSDRPREEQLKMQARVRKAGGVYEFVSTVQQFYDIYDRIVSPELFL